MGFSEQGDDVGAWPGRCDKTDVERTFYHGIKTQISRDQRAIRAVTRLPSRFNVSGMQHKQDVSVHGGSFGKLPEGVSPLRVEEEGSGWQVTHAQNAVNGCQLVDDRLRHRSFDVHEREGHVATRLVDHVVDVEAGTGQCR